MVLLVDEEATDVARSTVEVLVRTPARKVDPPVVQLERGVAYGMR